MLKKTPIILCLGSSCFARGNQNFIKLIKKYIEKKNISDRVEFRGDHCFDKCSEGPNMLIGNQLYQGITESNITGILDKALAEII